MALEKSKDVIFTRLQKEHPHTVGLDLDLFIRETEAFHVKSPQFTAPPLESSPVLRRKEKKSIEQQVLDLECSGRFFLFSSLSSVFGEMGCQLS